MAQVLPAERDLRRVIGDVDGAGDREVEGVGEQQLLDIYRSLVRLRTYDERSVVYHRQGRIGPYAIFWNHEAMQAGPFHALDDEDWIFPSYRELGAAVVRGVDLVEYLHFYRATWHGGTYDANAHRFGMVSVPVGSQILHAVGYAMGAKLDEIALATLVYFGDGATSEGDFHEGCNFAAVFRSPVVFFCQNNQWAISVPLSAQTVAPIWKKAEAYGFPGVLVDGNDVLAVYQVTKEAAARAREEGTPTLIEAVTYRMGPHSTADDASRYRPGEEVDQWKAMDPLDRYRSWLASSDVADQAFFEGVEGEAKQFAAKMRAGVIASDPRPVEELFEWVFADLPPHLARQRDEALRFASGDGGGSADG